MKLPKKYWAIYGDPKDFKYNSTRIITCGNDVGMTVELLEHMAVCYKGSIAYADEPFVKERYIVGDIFGMTFNQILDKQQGKS